MSFGYIPDFQNKSRLKDLYLRIFGYPYAPRRNEARLICKLLKPRQGDRLLDIGCGDGVWTNELAKRGLDVTGLDVSDKDITVADSRARELKLRSNFVIGDAQKMPFEDEFFDRCFSISVFEHIADDDKAFREVYRVLKPGGILVISVLSQQLPFGFGLMSRLPRHIKSGFASAILLQSANEVELKHNFDTKFKHYRRYDEKLLVTKATQFGFKLEQTAYNSKFVGSFVNGIIHSLKIFEWQKKNGYRLANLAALAVTFPLFYGAYLLDDLVPLRSGCGIVMKFRKEGSLKKGRRYNNPQACADGTFAISYMVFSRLDWLRTD